MLLNAQPSTRRSGSVRAPSGGDPGPAKRDPRVAATEVEARLTVHLSAPYRGGVRLINSFELRREAYVNVSG
jgi:hypothetical protein